MQAKKVNPPPYSQQEIEILKNYYVSHGVDFCVNLLNRPRHAVIVKAFRLGLKTKNRKIPVMPKRELPTPKIRNFLPRKSYKKNNQERVRDSSILTDLTNPFSVYLLGFVWADGYLSKLQKDKVAIKITERDEDSLDFLFENLCVWNKYLRTKQNENWLESVEYSTSNILYKNFLIENGYLMKSGGSPQNILNQIPSNLRHYWFLGYLDGDGTISKEGNSVQFASTIDQDWSFLEKICEELGVTGRSYTTKNSRGQGSLFGIFLFTDAFKFLNYIYKNKIEGLGFQRKYERFLLFREKFLTTPLKNVRKNQREEFLKLTGITREIECM